MLLSFPLSLSPPQSIAPPPLPPPSLSPSLRRGPPCSRQSLAPIRPLGRVFPITRSEPRSPGVGRAVGEREPERGGEREWSERERERERVRGIEREREIVSSSSSSGRGGGGSSSRRRMKSHRPADTVAVTWFWVPSLGVPFPVAAKAVCICCRRVGASTSSFAPDASPSHLASSLQYTSEPLFLFHVRRLRTYKTK